MDQSTVRSQIEQIAKQRVQSKFPRGAPDSHSDAVVDLAEYDGYIGGLTGRFLQKSPRPLPVATIVLPRDLEKVFEAPTAETPALAEFRKTWLQLRALAELLSQATGIPLERK
jgi:hypothetical protein